MRLQANKPNVSLSGATNGWQGWARKNRASLSPGKEKEGRLRDSEVQVIWPGPSRAHAWPWGFLAG